MLRKAQISTSTTKNKQTKAIFFDIFILFYQNTLVIIWLENAKNSQNRAGWDFFSGVLQMYLKLEALRVFL